MTARDFDRWIAEPCPGDEWLYRGQAVEYRDIVPSALRPNSRAFASDRLRNIDPRTVSELIGRSPVQQISDPQPGVVDREMELATEGSESYLRSELSAQISWSRFVRALAQHYSFPTLYVDLTLDPRVAAAFATSACLEAGRVAGATGTVYRWPAKRESAGRLSIGGISVVDLSQVGPHFRRPTIQSSAMALPVILPDTSFETSGVPGAPQLFPVGASALEWCDMSELTDCESFELAGPPRDTPPVEAMFPDAIDLGYSYMTVAALMSLIAHYPEEYHDEADKRAVDGAEEMFRSTLRAAQVVLDRECFRLVPDLGVTSWMREPLESARYMIRYQAEAAVSAIGFLASDESLRERAKARRRVARDLLHPSGSDLCWLLSPESPYDVQIDHPTGTVRVYDVSPTPFDSGWIEPEIERRLALFEAVFDRCGNRPAYAVGDPPRYADAFRSLPCKHAYQATVANQIQLQNVYTSASNLFPNAADLARRES